MLTLSCEPDECENLCLTSCRMHLLCKQISSRLSLAGLFGTACLILGELDSKTSAFCVMFKSTNSCLHVCLVMPGCAIPKRTPPARLKAGSTSGLSRVELRNKKENIVIISHCYDLVMFGRVISLVKAEQILNSGLCPNTLNHH